MITLGFLVPLNAWISMVVGYFGLPFVMNLYQLQHRGLSATETGAAFLPMMFRVGADAVQCPIGGALVRGPSSSRG